MLGLVERVLRYKRIRRVHIFAWLTPTCVDERVDRVSLALVLPGLANIYFSPKLTKG